MIINCPECSTGFQLPDERVTPKGTKLKCSRCKHVFRVRADADGEPEIFYRDGDNNDKKSAKKKKKKKKGGLGSSSPFPHAGGLDIKSKKKGAGGGGSDDDEMEAFDSAFDDEKASELKEVAEESAAVQEVSEVSEAEEEEDVVPGLIGNSGSDFGDPADHVDPAFGEDGPSFDPVSGQKVAASKPAGPGPKGPGPKGPGPRGPGPNTSQAPPTAAATAGPPTGRSKAPAAASTTTTPQAAAQPQSATSPSEWDDDDLAAHRIGGGPAMKVVTFMLLVSFVGMSFVGIVAYQNDGFIDFQAFPEMLDVAFSDGEYEPREEWGAMGPNTTIIGPQNPVEVESVHGELVALGGDHIFVVQGMVRNHEDTRIDDVELRAMITSAEGRTIREILGTVGEDVPVTEFRSLRSTGDVDDLVSSNGVSIDSGDVVPFTMVFSNPPQRVVDGERFMFRVEVADVSGGSDSMAAQN